MSWRADSFRGMLTMFFHEELEGLKRSGRMKRKRKPYGREEVTAAVLETSARMFSKHGVEGISLRKIADATQVNLGLIHRHFGSKENLRLKVQEFLAAGVRDDVGSLISVRGGTLAAVKALRKHEDFWRVLARTLLDGKFEGDVQSEFPFLPIFYS